MSGNIEQEKIEQECIDTIERRLDTLRSIADFARNALDETADYKERDAVLATLFKVAAAGDRIRRELACGFYENEQENAAPVPGTDTPKHDWLEMPGGFRMSRFHVAGRTTFVGARKNHGDNGGNIYVVEVRRGKDCESAFFKFTRNGERICDGFFYFGRAMAEEQAAVGMLHGYLARIEKDRQHNKRNKKNRQARKAAANAAAEIANGEGTK